MYKYGSVRIPYIEVTGARGKRHFVYANLVIYKMAVGYKVNVLTHLHIVSANFLKILTEMST